MNYWVKKTLTLLKAAASKVRIGTVWAFDLVLSLGHNPWYKKTNWGLGVDESRFDQLKDQLRQFAAEREWDQFHSPKNLSMALIGEAAEVIEHFQWLTEEQSRNLPPEKLAEIELELADVQIYLLRLADKLNLDLLDAVEKKLTLNAKKYPAEKVRGSSKKYSDYDK